MSRRAATFAVASLLVLALVVFGALLPVPYVALLPGPTTNTLGEVDGKPLIVIEGHRTYADKGHLNLVTVAYRGSPNDQIDLLTALRGWVDPHVAVVPQQELFPKGQSVKQVLRETTRQMQQSQESATTAALRELHIPVTPRVAVAEAEKGYPAYGVLREGDVITRVDGKDVDAVGEVAKLVSAHEPGETVRLTVERGGKDRRVEVRTTGAKDQPGHAVVGVILRADNQYPFTVDIRLHDVGGPSAGLMFALGIVDKLTPGSLTGGRFVAGTGEITPAGEVKPIGGIAQKMVGARSAGATVFLTPAQNCAAAEKTAPGGLRLVKVTTLRGALQALRALRTGKGEVPSCG